MYPLGVPHTVVVDDQVPRVTFDEGKVNGMAAPGVDKSMWGPLLEKAAAKMYGNYEHLVGGAMAMGVRAMIGGAHVYVNNKTLSSDQIWAELQKHEKTDNIITAGTDGFGDHNQQKPSGLSMSHAYTVLGTKLLSDGTKLVKMRNPWGKEDYKDKFSDKSAEWTPARRKEVGDYKKANDGVFYMPIDIYKRDFEETQVNIDPTDMHSAYFLRLNDDGTGSSACTVNTKSKACRKHVVTVTSTVAQKLYITAHTWD